MSLPRTGLGMQRAGRGMTVQNVARALGISEWEYRNIEYGRRKVSETERGILAKLFPPESAVLACGRNWKIELARLAFLQLTKDERAAFLSGINP